MKPNVVTDPARTGALGALCAFLCMLVPTPDIAAPLDLSALRGRVVYPRLLGVVVRTLPAILPWMESMRRSYEAQGLTVIAVNVDRDRADADRFLQQFRPGFDLLARGCALPFLVNFGGDLRANKRPPHGPWQVGIERPDTDRTAAMLLELEHGALATSGDSHRFLLKDSVRYSHILDPRTGWPVTNAPRSVTVAASSCTEAGLLATLAMLEGGAAESFLEAQGCRHWVMR